MLALIASTNYKDVGGPRAMPSGLFLSKIFRPKLLENQTKKGERIPEVIGTLISALAKFTWLKFWTITNSHFVCCEAHFEILILL